MTDEKDSAHPKTKEDEQSADEITRNRVVIPEGSNLRTIISSGIATVESVSSRLGQPDLVEISDEVFSFTLTADLPEAIEFCVELLISRGYLSFVTDFWIEQPYEVRFDEPFDEVPPSGSIQHLLKQAISQRQELIDEFVGVLEIKPAAEDSNLIFHEMERIICRRGGLFTSDWYAARILREAAFPTGKRNEFLIGNLWEQLRVKETYEADLEKRQQQISRLRENSSTATAALVQRSNTWKDHALRFAKKSLAKEPRNWGRWSAIAGELLNIIEELPQNSPIRSAYIGKRSKNKPDGTTLIDIATIAKFLSREMRD